MDGNVFYVNIEDLYDVLVGWIPPLSEILITEESIKENGILVPLDVMFLPSLKKYLVIHGHHRYYIAEKLSIKKLPCVLASNDLIQLFVELYLLNFTNIKEDIINKEKNMKNIVSKE